MKSDPQKRFECTACSKRFRTKEGVVDHSRTVHNIAVADEVTVTCLECGGEGKPVTGQTIYPHRPDLFDKKMYLCDCGAYCGCHGVTWNPLGHPAGPETRKARMAAHDAFDPLWRNSFVFGMSRREAYTWLAAKLNIRPEECHIGMMSAERALQVVQYAHALREERGR